MLHLISNNILLIAIAVIVLLAVVLFITYVKAPPSLAYVISGISRKPRLLIGSGGFRVPFFERLDQVYLGQISVDIKTDKSVPTKDFINVDVDAVAKVGVLPTEDGVRLAAKNFLNMSPMQIVEQLTPSLQGNLREIIGTLDLKSLNIDRDGFSTQVLEKAKPDMEKLGIEVISCNIQNVTDKEDAIKDLGADNLAQIKKDAAINRAKAEKEANDERVNADIEIEVKKNELEKRKASLKKDLDKQKAEADAVYAITEQEQKKTINIKTVEAEIEKTKQEKVLTQEKVDIKANELKAEVEKTADADKYKIEKTAEAKLEQEKREAEAKKYAMEQEAAGIRAKGEAEAYAIEKKGEAEAKAMEKKAEAYKKYNNAAITQMIVDVLPAIVKNAADPISTIKEVKIFSGGGSGENGGIASISGNVPVVIKQAFDVVKETVGVDMAEVVKAQTLEAKTTRNINIGGKAGEAVEGLVEGLQEGVSQE